MRRFERNQRAEKPGCAELYFQSTFLICLLCYPQGRGRVKSTVMQTGVGKREIVQYQNRIRENFSNGCKKSLAFLEREGVASATVQGLKVARRSLDGEAMRGFRKVGLERIGRMWELALWERQRSVLPEALFPNTLTQTERDPVALSTQRFAQRN
jgi:hypothetical protein